ncbi:MAG TPA: MCP four helix bundle domain-containing protein, partial [Accumulibacter sp.]|uniref:MCP four helix bundle domain-containing protein n=1 Tax=Accumulibacter sp. TaxID=2053492 RepID=UPI002CAF53C5
MTVSKKMMLLILTALIGALSLAGLGIRQMNRVYDSADYGNANSVPSLLVLSKNVEQFNGLRARLYRFLLVDDPSRQNEMEDKIRDSRARLQDGFRSYEKLISDDTDRRFLQDELALFAEYDRRTSEALDLVRARRKGEGVEHFLAVTPVSDRLNATLSEHLSYNEKLATQASAAAAAVKDSALLLLLGIAAVTVLAVAALGLFITRQLMQQLGGEPG